MTAHFLTQPASRFRAASLVLLALGAAACSNGDGLANSENPPPVDTTPPIDTTPPPIDTTPPPIDTTPPPIDSGPPPTHVGIGFGPTASPWELYGPIYSGSNQNGQPDNVLANLAAARRASARITISFTGNEQYNRDENGFSLAKWKQRVDRFRGMNFDSYIADGTLLGHLILDEPSDPGNWSGKIVPQADIEAMAKYSREIWPNLTVIIRAWPDYLEGGSYPNLDATWIQYHERFGDIENFISKRLHTAHDLGLTVVGGLNVINGGGPNSGMPSYSTGKRAMNATQLRNWGERMMKEDICLFILWEYRESYFSRPDIQEAMEHLADVARGRPKRDCNN
jgi:hypothetical protein